MDVCGMAQRSGNQRIRAEVLGARMASYVQHATGNRGILSSKSSISSLTI